MSIRYLLVDVDGVASFGSQADPHAQWLSNLVGPEGKARVRLHDTWLMAGWVNDCGLLMPDRYPRNVVGGVLLGTLGGPQQPYAGPVVITGWDDSATMRGDVEICTLQHPHVKALRQAVDDIRKVLGLDPGTPTHSNPEWARDVRKFAEFVRDGEFQGPTVVTGDDAIAALLGRRIGGE